MGKNKNAVALAKMGAGISRTFSLAERERRRQQMTELNRKRLSEGKVKGNSHNRRAAKRKINYA